MPNPQSYLSATNLQVLLIYVGWSDRGVKRAMRKVPVLYFAQILAMIVMSKPF